MQPHDVTRRIVDGGRAAAGHALRIGEQGQGGIGRQQIEAQITHPIDGATEWNLAPGLFHIFGGGMAGEHGSSRQ